MAYPIAPYLDSSSTWLAPMHSHSRFCWRPVCGATALNPGRMAGLQLRKSGRLAATSPRLPSLQPHHSPINHPTVDGRSPLPSSLPLNAAPPPTDRRTTRRTTRRLIHNFLPASSRLLPAGLVPPRVVLPVYARRLQPCRDTIRSAAPPRRQPRLTHPPRPRPRQRLSRQFLAEAVSSSKSGHRSSQRRASTTYDGHGAHRQLSCCSCPCHRTPACESTAMRTA